MEFPPEIWEIIKSYKKEMEELDSFHAFFASSCNLTTASQFFSLASFSKFAFFGSVNAPSSFRKVLSWCRRAFVFRVSRL